MAKKEALSEELFLQAWVETGCDAKAAYLKLRPNVTPDSAATLGMRKLAACKSNGVYKSLLDKAYKNIEVLMDSDDENIKFKMTKDLLDRANGKAKDLTSGNKPLGVLVYLPKKDEPA